MDLAYTLLASILSAGGTGIITVIGMKTDLKWIKDILNQHGNRLHFLELHGMKKNDCE